MALICNLLLSLLQLIPVNFVDSMPPRGRLFKDAVDSERVLSGEFTKMERECMSYDDTLSVVFAFPVKTVDFSKVNETRDLRKILADDVRGRVDVIDNGKVLYEHVVMSGLWNVAPFEYPLENYGTRYNFTFSFLGDSWDVTYAFINVVRKPIQENVPAYRSLVAFLNEHKDWNFFVIRGMWGIWMLRGEKFLQMNVFPGEIKRQLIRVKKGVYALDLSYPLLSSGYGIVYELYSNFIKKEIPRKVKLAELDGAPASPEPGLYIFEDCLVQIRDGQPVLDWLYDTLGAKKFESVIMENNDPYFIVGGE